MTDRELMQEALDALTYVGDKAIYSDTIDALRARLAQEQMPTKIMGPNLEEVLNAAGFYKQREWVGLTDEEVKILATQGRTDFSRPMYNEFYSAVEAKLKEKNT